VHGGSAPQVKRKAEERLRALVDPAIAALEELLADKQHPQQRFAAAKEVLERDIGIGQVTPQQTTTEVHICTYEQYKTKYGDAYEAFEKLMLTKKENPQE
jgi:hypothetical protein